MLLLILLNKEYKLDHIFNFLLMVGLLLKDPFTSSVRMLDNMEVNIISSNI